MAGRRIVVDDKMQRDYRYELAAPEGRAFRYRLRA